MRWRIFVFIFTVFIGALSSAGELCHPLSKYDWQDPIGGGKSKQFQRLVERTQEALFDDGWRLSSEASCTQIKVLPLSSFFTGKKQAPFLQALSSEKETILDFYQSQGGFNISDKDYNKLVQLSLGLFGTESKSGRSFKYFVKNLLSQSSWVEAASQCLWKWNWQICMNQPPTSRGPTQIKNPPLIAEEYGINRDNLDDFRLAAVATMGFLIETLEWYRGILDNHCKEKECFYTIHNNEGVEEQYPFTYEDFIPALTYLYRGASFEILKNTATPDKSCYLKRTRAYMEYVQVWTRPCSE